MPVLIIVGAKSAPVLIEQEDEEAVLAKLERLDLAPPEARRDRTSAEAWLATLPAPSGWYPDADAASAAIAPLRRKRMH